MSHDKIVQPYAVSPLAGESAWRAGEESAWRAGGVSVSVGQFTDMIDTLRALQDTVAGCNPPATELATATRLLKEAGELLAAHQVSNADSVAGHIDMPGRGQTMSPVFVVEDGDSDSVRGTVRFGRFYLGGGSAVHGGAIPLVFDEVLGRLANAAGRAPSRTAYLHVNYRAVTPLDTELTLTAKFDREVGRKRYLVAELRDGDTLLADAEGLFVSLREGHL